MQIEILSDFHNWSLILHASMSWILEETQLIKCVEHLIVVGLGKDKFLQNGKLSWNENVEFKGDHGSSHSRMTDVIPCKIQFQYWHLKFFNGHKISG